MTQKRRKQPGGVHGRGRKQGSANAPLLPFKLAKELGIASSKDDVVPSGVRKSRYAAAGKV